MKNQIKIGSVLSYLQMGISIIIGLIYTPIMIRLLGQNEYGLYNTVASTISTLSILSLGFNSSYIRYFAIYKKHNDRESIYKLNGLFFVIFSAIGIIGLLCGGFFTIHLELIFSDGLTLNEYSIAKVLMGIMTINLAVSFPMSVFSNIISSNEEFVFLKLIGILNTVIGPLITLPLLLRGFKSIAVVSVSTAVSFVSYTLNIHYVFKRLNNRFIFHGFERGLFKSLFTFTAFIALNLVIDQINWNIDKILLGRLKGTTQVAVYSVGYALYGYYMMFSTSISGLFTPRIHNIVNRTKTDMIMQRQELTDLFVRVGRIQFLILALIASGIVFFGRSFIINVWAGVGYTDSYAVALLLIIPSTIALIQNLGIEIQRALNKHQFRSVVYFVMALLNLCLSIYLCQIYGAIGSAIGTAISLVLVNGIIMNLYYHKNCNINIGEFWKNIISLSKGLIAPIICGVVIVLLIPIDNTIVLFASITAYTLIYATAMWHFGMNNGEKELLNTIVRKICGR